MAPVFVVVGSTGEYSDRREWFVGYSTDKAEAEAHVKKLEAEYSEVDRYDDHGRMESDYARIRATLDPGFTSDYSGTKWTVVEVESLTALAAKAVA